MARIAFSGTEPLGLPPSSATALNTLTGPVRRWFVGRFGEPTPAQRLAWPALAAGRNLLLSAPTGSGKTLAAFLPILGRLLEEGSGGQGVRALYLAPLKALANDARRNLKRHLREIAALSGGGAPALRVGLRTGDTSARHRRLLRTHPPDILLTTPESLAVLLSQPWAAELFGDLRWVVVDEVHALAPGKRGADLALSLERLEHLRPGQAAGLQRVGLSATCSPLEAVSRFLAGTDRPCALARVDDQSPLELTIEPLPELPEVARGGFIARLVARLEPELARHRTTLVFTNVRSLAERLVWALRQRHPEWAEEIAPHHSGLARVRRRAVEARLKQGRLRAVVSSTSLELGIDIGTVDAVVLVHPPGGVVRLLQRVGRAGHGPGRVRRGLVLTATPAELLEAAVTAASSQPAQQEPLRPTSGPLDVLCQQLLGMAAQGSWLPDEAFAVVRGAYPYRDLPRDDFDACLDYLSGRRGDGTSWLPARLRWQGNTFTVADARTARILRRNIGSILTEEVRAVRLLRAPAGAGAEGADFLADRSTPLGEVDRTFADRLQPGDRFLLDGRCLEYRRYSGFDLLVEEVVGRPLPPRWAGEGWPLSGDLARRLYGLRERAAEALREGPAALVRLLEEEYGLRGEAVRALAGHFQLQECLSEIPDAGTCLVEVVACEGGVDHYLHTPLNRAGNDALARVLVYRLVRRRGWAVQSQVADLGLAVFSRGSRGLGPADWRELLSAEGFEAELDEAIRESETLRERFHRTALVGLMLLRNPLGGRPRVGGADWAERRLFDKVREAAPDFILLRQALREVREEYCDLEAARAYLEALPRLALRCRPLAQTSPFAAAWTQSAIGPGETSDGPTEALERLHALLRGG